MSLFKKKQEGESEKPKVKVVKETKCTCNQCGKVWYFGKQDDLQQKGKAMQIAGLTCMCPCLMGCMGPLIKAPKNLKQCPQCQSKNITTEEVAYDVAK